MAGSGVRGAIAGTVVFLAALIAAMAGMMLVAPFGLTVPEAVVWPLAVGFGALVAALAGGWAANAVAADRGPTRHERALAPAPGPGCARLRQKEGQRGYAAP